MTPQIQIIGNKKRRLDDLVREAAGSDLVREVYEEVAGLKKIREKIKEIKKDNLKSEVLDREIVGIGKIKKVVDGFNGGIEHFYEKNGKLYVGGSFEKVGNLELDGKGIVEVDLTTREVKKIVDGFNDWIEHFYEKNGKLYVGGDFKKAGNLKLNGNGIVEVELKYRSKI